LTYGRAPAEVGLFQPGRKVRHASVGELMATLEPELFDRARNVRDAGVGESVAPGEAGLFQPRR